MNKRGFTLIEMMVGIAILSILVSIAIPNYLTWNARYQFKDTARMLSSNLVLTRISSMSRNTGTALTLQAVGGVTQYNSEAPGMPTMTFPADVSVNGALPVTVNFNQFGQRTSGGAGNQIINLDSTEQPNTRYVLTITTSGKVTIVMQNI